MLKVSRLQKWLQQLKEDEDLKLVMDCFSGTAYLKIPKPGGWEHIDLKDGTIQGCVSGRISCNLSTIQEVDRNIPKENTS